MELLKTCRRIFDTIATKVFHPSRRKTDKEYENEQLKGQVDLNNNSIINLQVEVANRDNTINTLKNRKLTWKERFSGKIITKDDDKVL